MWIRSKDKTTLVYCEHVKVDKNRIYGSNYKIGEYETEERALEILNLIQDRIIKGTKFDELNGGKRRTRDFVFNMPEE